MSKVRLGTRGSRLALTQSRTVARAIEESVPGISVELVEISTSGDLIRDVPLGPELGQSFFTKEIEQSLLDDRIDLAVHSCKDLATVMPEGLALTAVPPRVDARDALIGPPGGIAALPEGASIGTSSMRRKGFLAAMRPDLDIRDQRGNVPTRLKAVEDGRMDAIVLAVAGLTRLGLQDHIAETFDVEAMVPAAAQGALALQTRADDPDTVRVVHALNHEPSRLEVTAERACLRTLGAGCQAPVGAHARVDEGIVSLHAAVVSPHGIVRAEDRAPAAEAERLGADVAREILSSLEVESLREDAWAGPPPASQSREP